MEQNRRKYRKPVIKKVVLDNSISLVMMTAGNPDPRSDTKRDPKPDPFESPFDDKPFG